MKAEYTAPIGTGATKLVDWTALICEQENKLHRHLPWIENRGGFYSWHSPMTGCAIERSEGNLTIRLISEALRPHLINAFIRCTLRSDHYLAGTEFGTAFRDRLGNS